MIQRFVENRSVIRLWMKWRVYYNTECKHITYCIPRCTIMGSKKKFEYNSVIVRWLWKGRDRRVGGTIQEVGVSLGGLIVLRLRGEVLSR